MKARYGLLLLLITSMMLSCSKEKADILIGLNEPIHHDDFEYSVTGYTIERQIGDGPSAIVADGNFYIVTFLVRNNARRVNHSWDNTIAYLVDDAGKTYENNTNAQVNLNKSDPFGYREKYTTTYQSSDSTRLIFDLPKNTIKPCLMVRGETLMGDFFDGGKFKRTKIRLY